jgi:hypothetical protein
MKSNPTSIVRSWCQLFQFLATAQKSIAHSKRLRRMLFVKAKSSGLPLQLTSLLAFVHYCTTRIVREAWTGNFTITMTSGGENSTVTRRKRNRPPGSARGNGTMKALLIAPCWQIRRLLLGLAVVVSLPPTFAYSEADGTTILVPVDTKPSLFELADGTKSGQGILSAITSAIYSSSDGFTAYANTDEKRKGSRLLDPPDCPSFAKNTAEEESNNNNNNNNHSLNHNRLECFLWNLKVPIPDESFKKDFVTITIHDMVCTNIQLLGVETKYSKTNQSQDDKLFHMGRNGTQEDDLASTGDVAELNVAIRQVWATCSGKYHFTGGISGDVQATVSGLQSNNDYGGNEVGEQAAAEVVFALHSSESKSHYTTNATASRLSPPMSYTSTTNSGRRPTKIKTTSCQLRLDVPWIHFSGSVSAKLIQLFAHTISGYIVDALNGKICPALVSKVDPLANMYLDRFNTFCNKYLPKGKQDEHHRQQQEGSLRGDDKEVLNVKKGAEPDESQPSSQAASTRQLVNDINVLSSKSHSVVDYSVVHSILTLFNQQLENHLQDGWVPIPGDGGSSILPLDCRDMFRGISGWWASLFGKVTHVILPSVLQHFVISVPILIDQNVSLSVNLSCVDVSGIDTMDTLQVLAPIRDMETRSNDTHNSSARMLRTKIVSDQGFFVVAPVLLELLMSPTTVISHDEWTNNSIIQSRNNIVPLLEYFQIKVNLTNIVVSIDTILDVVHWDDTSALQVVLAVEKFVETLDVHDLDCLIQTLYDIQIASNQDAGAALIAQMVVNSIRLSRNRTDAPEGSLEADIDRAINTVLEMALYEYKGLWGELIQGLVQGPGRRRLNRFVRDWIDGHSQPPPAANEEHGRRQQHCPTPKRMDIPKWVNFSKFELLDKMNAFLAHSHTKRTMNHFLRCLGETVEIFANTTTIDSFPWSDAESDPLLDFSTSALYFLKMMFGHKHSLRHDDDSTSISFIDDARSKAQEIKLSNIKTLYWGSLDQLQLIKPSGDTRLNSSMIFGRSNDKINTNEIEFSTSIITSEIRPPPQVAFTIDLDSPKVFGQINLTVFATLEATAEVQIDYDINRLENLSVAHLLEQVDCGLLPAIEIRLLPGSTALQFGKNLGANITATLNDINISLSTEEHPNLHEISNEILNWSQEWVRNLFNMVIKEWMRLSVDRCPGVLFPSDNEHGRDGGKESASWRNSLWLWVILVAFGLVQGGLVWIAQSSKIPDNVEYDTSAQLEDYHSLNDASTARTEFQSSILSCYEELVNPFSGLAFRRQNEQEMAKYNARELDQAIRTEICEDFDDMYAPHHVILEDQLLPPISYPKRQISLFASKRVPETARYLIPTMILLTIILLITSNVSVGASVDLYVMLGNENIPVSGLFTFSLGNTASELFQAGVYPLLFLVVCFSGIWPYAKLLWMLRCWMIPNQDRRQRERRLNMLDALGKFSLVDTYVLVLFVVAFRFHLEMSESLGIDVYVTPTYGFYSFLLATFVSLMAGHAILFYHRRESRQDAIVVNTTSSRESILEHGFRVEDEGPTKRLARCWHVILIAGLISALMLLTIGFSQECFTFEFGGLAGLALGDDHKRTSYSVLSLGAAIPQSSHGGGSFAIYCLEGAFFFFTVMMPILGLFVVMILMVCPMTVAWQQSFLVMAEITNAWSSVEVFLLSIVTALFQISSFASFMVGDKCNVIDQLAAELFNEGDQIVCFTVIATVQSSSMYLIIGALINSLLISISLRFARVAVHERVLQSQNNQDHPRPQKFNTDELLGSTLPHKLCTLPIIGSLLFVGEIEPTNEFVVGDEAPFEQCDRDDDESDDLSSG